MLVETKPKRKRKTVERLYVGDAVLNIEDDEDTDDKKSETRLAIEGKKERPQSSNRKIFYKQKTFIAVRNESSMFNLNLIIRKKRCLKEF
jgi:hypothetical protein